MEYSEERIVQNLRDADCDSSTIAAFVQEVRENKIAEGLKLLSLHRRGLLEKLHREQKRIDCLDYLVYTIKKTENKQHKI